jgi:hypothetical protein
LFASLLRVEGRMKKEEERGKRGKDIHNKLEREP